MAARAIVLVGMRNPLFFLPLFWSRVIHECACGNFIKFSHWNCDKRKRGKLGIVFNPVSTDPGMICFRQFLQNSIAMKRGEDWFIKKSDCGSSSSCSPPASSPKVKPNFSNCKQGSPCANAFTRSWLSLERLQASPHVMPNAETLPPQQSFDFISTSARFPDFEGLLPGFGPIDEGEDTEALRGNRKRGFSQLAASSETTPRDELNLSRELLGGENVVSKVSLSTSSSSDEATNTSQSSKRRSRMCTFPECTNSARGKGLCKRHGGGRRCYTPGCKKGARSGSFHCTAHGGGPRCQILGCKNGAEGSSFFCVRHGGGKQCLFTDCQRKDQGGGFCKAHGGGRRCSLSRCTTSARAGHKHCTFHFRNPPETLEE